MFDYINISIVAPLILTVIILFIDLASKLSSNIKSVLESFYIALLSGSILNIYLGPLTEINKRVEALAYIASSTPIYNPIGNISATHKHVQDMSDPLVKQIFTNQLKRMLANLDLSLNLIRENKLFVPKEDALTFGMSVFEAAKESVVTTSFVSPVNWWINKDGSPSARGQEYLEKNEEAIRRGVKVTRYFIYSDQGELDRLSSVIRDQKSTKIEIYTVKASKLTDPTKNDIIIIDGKIIGELSIDSTTREFDKATVSSSLVDLNRGKNIINFLKRAADRQS